MVFDFQGTTEILGETKAQPLKLNQRIAWIAWPQFQSLEGINETYEQ